MREPPVARGGWAALALWIVVLANFAGAALAPAVHHTTLLPGTEQVLALAAEELLQPTRPDGRDEHGTLCLVCDALPAFHLPVSAALPTYPVTPGAGGLRPVTLPPRAVATAVPSARAPPAT
jgi:hypothetical protein